MTPRFEPREAHGNHGQTARRPDGRSGGQGPEPGRELQCPGCPGAPGLLERSSCPDTGRSVSPSADHGPADGGSWGDSPGCLQGAQETADALPLRERSAVAPLPWAWWLRAPALPDPPDDWDLCEPYDAFNEWAIREAHRLPWVTWCREVHDEAGGWRRLRPEFDIGSIGRCLVPLVCRHRCLGRLLVLVVIFECDRVRADLRLSMWITRRSYWLRQQSLSVLRV